MASESTMSNNTDAAGGERTQFDYLLNALELASQSDKPADHGYGAKRRALFAYVRDLECRAAPSAGAQPAAQEPVGVVGTMPGTDGFTMACFKADDVPVGTKLYAAPHPAPQQPDARDAPIKDRAALESTLRFIEKKVWPQKCDGNGVSDCWRCQSVYLASRMRELLSESAARDALVRELVEALRELRTVAAPVSGGVILNTAVPTWRKVEILAQADAALSKVPGATS